MKIIEGNLTAKDLQIGIVVSRFNDFITAKLFEGAVDCLVRHAGDEISQRAIIEFIIHLFFK